MKTGLGMEPWPIQGVLLEEPPADGAGGGAEDGEPDDELAAVVADDGKGGKVVPLAKMLEYKKNAKALDKRLKELEPVAAEAAALKEKLTAASPYIDALVADPTLRARAIAKVKGEPVVDGATDDVEAAQYAEMHGLYLTDGVTPDRKRARENLNWLDARSRKQNEEALRPLATLTLNQRAEANLQQALTRTAPDGSLMASSESVREVASQLPANLLADPRVVDLVLNSAVGVDRAKGRTPKAPDEPVWMPSPGSGGGHRGPVVDAETKRTLARLGVSEKDYTESSQKLEEAASARRAIALE